MQYRSHHAVSKSMNSFAVIEAKDYVPYLDEDGLQLQLASLVEINYKDCGILLFCDDLVLLARLL